MRAASLLGVLFDFLEEYEDGEHPADVCLARFFKQRRYLGSRDRRFIGDGIFAWLRHRPRGETRWTLWCRAQGLELPAEGRTRHLGSFLAIAADGLFPWGHEELATAARGFAAAQGGGWVQALDRALERPFPGGESWPGDELERLAAECSLPCWVTERLVRFRGAEWAARLGAALLEPAPVDLRVALSRVEREVARRELEEFSKCEVEPTPISPAGLRLRGRLDLKRFLKQHGGTIEVQDEGSQIAAMAAAPKPGQTIIDACAGGGGKLLALADLVGGDARLHACEIDSSKLAALMRRAEPLGLRSLTPHAIGTDGKLPATLPNHADVVFVDAPCSGLGSLRRNPDLKYRWSEEDVARFTHTQRGILGRFAERVRPGGLLVYVTCSILSEENEDVAGGFLNAAGDFDSELPAVAKRLPPEAVTPRNWLRLDPATTGTDGFFVACFRRAPQGAE